MEGSRWGGFQEEEEEVARIESCRLFIRRWMVVSAVEGCIGGSRGRVEGTEEGKEEGFLEGFWGIYLGVLVGQVLL